jgi:hypothetical protein
MRARLVVMLIALGSMLAAGCASMPPGPSLASSDNLVWDCGWRPMP